MKKTQIPYVLCAVGIVCIVIFLAVLKYRTGEINYRNSDAAWHTLLTIEAYDSTPVSQHKFLPVVTLGQDADKFISWGAAIPDKKGNFYYTSFSPAGFFLPYCFLKIFNLPVDERGLYIFNSFLFSLSAIVWFGCLCVFFRKSSHRIFIAVTGSLIYICSPELLHGMGLVYWHQSIMQITLPLQILCYYIWKTTKRSWSQFFFFAFVLINPYIEWTGYVANAGYFMAEIFFFWKHDRKKTIQNALFIALLTVCSFVLFSVHYLSTVSPADFWGTLQARFLARNTSTPIPFAYKVFFDSCIDSFYYSILLCILLSVLGNLWTFRKKSRCTSETAMLCFLLAFPCLENIIMRQHALSYTFDRMKFIFILSFLICYFGDICISSIGSEVRKKVLSVLFFLFAILTCYGNIIYYLENNSYVWDTDYRKNNEKIAAFIKEKQIKNAILTTSGSVRGYLTLLFKRGIYEGGRMPENADKNIIKLQITPQPWDMHRIDGFYLYNHNNNSGKHITFNKENEITETDISLQRLWDMFYLTDDNWERGYCRHSGGFFVENTPTNRDKYQLGDYIELPGKILRKIIHINTYAGYLNIFTEGEKFVTELFPHELKVIPQKHNTAPTGGAQ